MKSKMFWQRTAEIKSLLAKGNGNTDERHEVEFMLDCLIQDDINDTSITIPSSILIYQKDLPRKKLIHHLISSIEEIYRIALFQISNNYRKNQSHLILKNSENKKIL